MQPLYRLNADLPIDNLLGRTWEAARKTCPQTSVPKSAKDEPTAKPRFGAEPQSGAKPRIGGRIKPAKLQESSLLKANLAEKLNASLTLNQEAGSEPGRRPALQVHRARDRQTRGKGSAFVFARKFGIAS
jgi:hypothetical protein